MGSSSIGGYVLIGICRMPYFLFANWGGKICYVTKWSGKDFFGGNWRHYKSHGI